MGVSVSQNKSLCRTCKHGIYLSLEVGHRQTVDAFRCLLLRELFPGQQVRSVSLNKKEVFPLVVKCTRYISEVDKHQG